MFPTGPEFADRRSKPRRQTDQRAAERRRPRLVLPGLAVRVMRSGSAGPSILQGRLHDISATGARLTLAAAADGTDDTAFVAGETLLLEARLGNGSCLNLATRIAWAKLAPDGVALGVRFPVAPAGSQLSELRRLAAAG